MIDLVVDLASTVPPFEQVRWRLAELIRFGALAPGTKLPTVRRLAADLQLSVGTIARAYQELEAVGIILTAGRRGTFVLSPSQAVAAVSARAAALAAEARGAGLSNDEAINMLKAALAALTR